tara:strand:- start:13 stop:795 length:783 start_codon:yes stop_codon:yes gene_type:complete
MQPRLNIAIKACRVISESINKIYKSKDQDDLRSYDDMTTVLFKHIVENINESYPFGDQDLLGPSNAKRDALNNIITGDGLSDDIEKEEKIIWIINPIDSLKNFTNKLPIFNITITLMKNGIAEATVIYNPIQDYLITAIKGQGALSENRKIRTKSISQEKLLYVINDEILSRNLSNSIDGESRILGSPSTELTYLASNQLDLVIYPNIDIWDSAAGVLVCQESGLLLSNINGGQDIYSERSLIGAPTWLHKKILKKINQS